MRVLFYLMTLNSAVNPWIYMIFNPNLVEALCNACCGGNCCREVQLDFTPEIGELHMVLASEVTFDLGIELNDLNYPGTHVHIASNSHFGGL